MLTTFLETCMKLLHDSKTMKGLHEFIKGCVGNTLSESCVVRNIGKDKTRMGWEMRLTVWIGDYEMD